MKLAGEHASTGDGFLVGVEPASPQRAADWPTQQMTPAQQVAQPVTVTDNTFVPSNTTGRLFTEEELEAARRQEKDKLYGRIEQMDQQLKTLAQEREEALKAQQAEMERLAEEQKKKEEAELSTRALLERKEQEWNDRFKTLEQQREQDRAVYEMERRVVELDQYRQARLEQEAEFIIPQLRDLVRGNNEQEIDMSIEEMKARTDDIMGNISAVVSQPTPMYRGAAPTSPPVGPMEQLSTQQTLTPEDIRSMDIETYKRYRDQLLASASRSYRGY
jgi:DNA repair exonuclease SbcCD ATPase subunit